LVFDLEYLEGPATLGNELTYVELLKICDQLMEGMQLRIGLAGSVREALLVNLAEPMSFDALSRQLKISARTLKRRLRAEGTSYRKIVDELRTELAIKYLRDTELSVEDIASCLGFGDAASFRHAFVRWTNVTPGKFRRRTGVPRKVTC
jgi:AraC-like DNA-binding protein